MKRRWWFALALSLCLHSWGGSLIKDIPPPLPRKSGNGSGDKENGDDGSGSGPQKIKIKMGPIRGENGEIVEMSLTGKNGEPCFEYFGGIGVYHDGWGVITEVIPNYPAARLGLRPGDKIDIMGGIVGEIGTPVTFTYTRNGVPTTVTVKRERICTRHNR